MKIVNCGCGMKYDKRMINVDFVAPNDDIICCDLTKGLPFKDGEVDWVYSSHFMEHLSYDQAMSYLKECHRVLKPNGGVRIVVPDLEEACRTYLKQLDAARADRSLASRYEYSVIELLDQMTRDHSGGRMMDYWFSEDADMEYLKERYGTDVRAMVRGSRMSQIISHPIQSSGKIMSRIIAKIFSGTRFYKTYSEGKVSMNGEKHRWMYDSLGMELLLEKSGFTNVSVKKYAESDIPEFADMKLELNDEGGEYKPHSIYLEAYKV